MKLTLLFIFLLAHAASAQEFVIKLTAAEDTAIKNRRFYFDAVVDNRDSVKNKLQVGRLVKGKKQTILVLDKEPEAAFLEYLQAEFPRRKTDTLALTYRINMIDCSSKPDGMMTEGKIKLDVDLVNSSTNSPVKNVTLEQVYSTPFLSAKAFTRLMEKIISESVKEINE